MPGDFCGRPMSCRGPGGREMAGICPDKADAVVRLWQRAGGADDVRRDEFMTDMDARAGQGSQVRSSSCDTARPRDGAASFHADGDAAGRYHAQPTAKSISRPFPPSAKPLDALFGSCSVALVPGCASARHVAAAAVEPVGAPLSTESTVFAHNAEKVHTIKFGRVP
jgi:hypothetical protein